MKKINLILAAIFLTIAGYSNAQVSIEVAILTPPLWGPVGYSEARYYYLPDIESYYDIKNSTFIYLDGNNWISDSKLPARFTNYDLDHGYKVVLTGYIGNTPYTHFKENKKQYVCGYCNNAQTTFNDIKPRTDNGPPIKEENQNMQAKK